MLILTYIYTLLRTYLYSLSLLVFTSAYSYTHTHYYSLIRSLYIHICIHPYILLSYTGFTDYNEEIVILLVRACIRCNDITTISTLLLQYKYNISAWMTATSYHLLVTQLLKEAATSAAVTPATSEVTSEAQALSEGEQHIKLLVNVRYVYISICYVINSYTIYSTHYIHQCAFICPSVLTHLYTFIHIYIGL